MKISARNVLEGTVRKITPGQVNTEVVIQLSGGEEVVSMISKEAADKLELQVGKKAYAIIKASSVMMAVD